MDGKAADYRREGLVSLWVGTFPSLEAAEVYFGIPDEIGVYLPPEAFARDLGVDSQLLDRLEVNFERMSPRPLRELLADATFSGDFCGAAVETASRMGISMAQGIALIYDFDYQAKPGWPKLTGPLTFIGTFTYQRSPAEQESVPRRDPRIEIRKIVDDVL